MLAASALLRLWDLASQGIVHYDEAVHLLEARFLRHAFQRHILGSEVPLAGLPLFHAKPLHAGLIAATGSLLGDRPWIGGALSALFGVFTTALVYHMGRRLWSREAGLLGAAVHAALPWSVLYGRSALAEADSAFFLLGFWWICAWKSSTGGRWGRTASAGLCAALVFLCNYRWGVLLLLLLGVEVARRSHDRWRRLALLAGCVLLPILAVALVYALVFLGPLLEAETRPRTYLEDLAYNLGKFGALGLAGRDPSRLPQFLWTFGGPVLLLGWLFGAPRFWRFLRRGPRPDGDRWSLIVLCAAPPLLFLFTPCGFPRCLSAALAPWALLSGCGFEAFVRRLQETGSAARDAAAHARGRAPLASVGSRALAPAIVLIVLVQAQIGRPLWGAPSGHAEAIRWLERRGERQCVSSQAYVCRVLGFEALPWPASIGELEDLRRRGVRYALADNQIWIIGHADTYREARQRVSPAATIPHPAGGTESFLWEAGEAKAISARRGALARDWFRPSVIRIYDLNDLFPGESGRALPSGPRPGL